MDSNSILILGTGALATLFAARLAAAGMAVTMLGTWPEGLVCLRQKGAQVEGEGRVYQVHATDNPAECKGILFALVLVKAWQTERAARQLSECLHREGVALTLQNGLWNDTTLIKELGPRRVARGVTTLGATLLGPGVVCLGGNGPVSIESQPCLSPLEIMIRQAGFVVDVVDNLQPLIWGKLVVNSAINPLTALLQVNNGELLERPSARMLLGKLANETAAVARELGVVLPFLSPELAVEEVALQTGENRSSMLQDILRGGPTEIDAINGAIIRLAEERFIQTPANWTVWSLVKAISVRGKIKI
jgi:2-dehydropantoate 2-reductase